MLPRRDKRERRRPPSNDWDVPEPWEVVKVASDGAESSLRERRRTTRRAPKRRSRRPLPSPSLSGVRCAWRKAHKLARLDDLFEHILARRLAGIDWRSVQHGEDLGCTAIVAAPALSAEAQSREPHGLSKRRRAIGRQGLDRRPPDLDRPDLDAVLDTEGHGACRLEVAGLELGGPIARHHSVVTALPMKPPIVLLILAGIKPLENRMRDRTQTRRVVITAKRDTVSMATLHDVLGGRAARVRQFVLRQGTGEEHDTIEVTFTRLTREATEDVVAKVARRPGCRRGRGGMRTVGDGGLRERAT